ncbi:hypothetical protein GCM10023075_33990 [Streptosporangium album]|uniref:transposase n=1 Tax=Streptosporangium album TaxID=47479 RepID=UPI0031E7D9DE
MFVSLATAIVCGARSVLEAERLQAPHAALFGVAPSDSTTRRALAGLDEAMLARIAKARARVRRRVRGLLHLRPGGFPWLTVAGKRLRGWIVIDIDIDASDKSGAAVTFKKTYGFHPPACWCANTQESPAMLLRAGNAGSDTVADHVRVLSDALAQIPNSCQAKILVRVDGAGATRDLLTHLEGLNTARRTVRYLVGWTITEADEQAVARLPATAWQDSLDQDGQVCPGYHVAELNGLNRRTGRPEGMRLLDPPADPARPGRPGARRARHHALPALPPARPPGHPRPPPSPADRAHLALGTGIRPGLAAPHPATGPRLSAEPSPQRPGRSPTPGRGTRRPRSDMRRPTPTAQGTLRARPRTQ